MTALVPRWLRATLTSAVLVVAVTAVIALLEPRAPALGLAVLYLLAVVPIALLYGAAVAGATSVASLLAFNYFFLTPQHTLNPGTSEEWEVLLAFLVSSLVVGHLAARSQRDPSPGEIMGRMFASLRDRLGFGSGTSDRVERRRQRRIRAATIVNHVNREDPHGAAGSSQPVRGRGPDRYQGRS